MDAAREIQRMMWHDPVWAERELAKQDIRREASALGKSIAAEAQKLMSIAADLLGCCDDLNLDMLHADAGTVSAEVEKHAGTIAELSAQSIAAERRHESKRARGAA